MLEACLAHGDPVYLMGNTVHPFMRDLAAAIDERAIE